MPINRSALIRYRIIDQCLSNHSRAWTLEDIQEECSRALQKSDDVYKEVGIRTLQLDMYNMKWDTLGFYAPIEVVNKKYYTYSDKDYSIFKKPLSEPYMQKLMQLMHTLKQFAGFSEFADMEKELKRIENLVYTARHPAKTIIDFEKNRDVKGMHFLGVIYDAIRDNEGLRVIYKDFDALHQETIFISPYLLKEYHNRWFLFGKKSHSMKITDLALDRMLAVDSAGTKAFEESTDFDAELYFRDQIGITRPWKTTVEKVEFWVESSQVPFITTKPFHSSQKLLRTCKNGSVFQLKVVHNFELEKELLGYGEAIEVLRPLELRQKLKSRVRKLAGRYK